MSQSSHPRTVYCPSRAPLRNVPNHPTRAQAQPPTARPVMEPSGQCGMCGGQQEHYKKSLSSSSSSSFDNHTHPPKRCGWWWVRRCRHNKNKPKRTGPSVSRQVLGGGHCLGCGQGRARFFHRDDKERRPLIAANDSDGSSLHPITDNDEERSPPECHATYKGSFNIYGERDGMGSMTWKNGDLYQGEFFNGNRHGHGTLSWSNGSEYVGEWECNSQHGFGTRRWNNGDVYSGQYQNGKRHGEGRFYFSNGDLYTGTLKNGALEGKGRYYYNSGQRFEGTFHKGKRQGKGKLQRLDGSLDIGVYDNDVRTGLGVRWSADRTCAWRMLDGLVKKRISIPEAVALDYDIDAAVRALSDGARVV